MRPSQWHASITLTWAAGQRTHVTARESWGERVGEWERMAPNDASGECSLVMRKRNEIDFFWWVSLALICNDSGAKSPILLLAPPWLIRAGGEYLQMERSVLVCVTRTVTAGRADVLQYLPDRMLTWPDTASSDVPVEWWPFGTGITPGLLYTLANHSAASGASFHLSTGKLQLITSTEVILGHSCVAHNAPNVRSRNWFAWRPIVCTDLVYW